MEKENPRTRGCMFALACSIGSMSVACGNLLTLSAYNEKISFQRGMFITSLGFVYFISLTDFFNKYLTETASGIQFRKKYRLMISDVMDITNKAVSAVQATLSCIAGVIVCNSSCRKSFLTASHYMSDAYAWFGTAYFVYDMWSMYKVHIQKISDKLKLIKDNSIIGDANDCKETFSTNGLYDELNKNGNGIGSCNNTMQKRNFLKGELKRFNKVPSEAPSFLYYCLTNPVMTIHHVFLGSFGLLVIVYLRGNFGDCVYSFIYLMELSTPFVSIRSILSTIGLKDSVAYVVNGLVMLATFFVCRVLMWPYVYYWYSGLVQMTVFQAIASLPLCCKIGTLILFLPQMYWFYLMVRGALKVFFPPANKKTESKGTEFLTNSTSSLNSGKNFVLPNNNSSRNATTLVN